MSGTLAFIRLSQMAALLDSARAKFSPRASRGSAVASILGGAGSLKAAQSELVSSGLLKVEGGSKPRIRSRRRLVEGRRSRVFCIDRDAVMRLAAHASVSKG